jgi:hypothetical protein
MKYARSKGKIFVCFLDSVFSCKKKKKEAAIYDTLRNERKMTDRRSRRGRGDERKSQRTRNQLFS